MLRKLAAAAVVALTAGAVGTATVSEAYPLPAPQSPGFVPSTSAIQSIAFKRKIIRHRGHGHRWVYSKRFGPRFRHRHGRYIYHYGGWWYPRPWWGVGVAVGPTYGYGYGYGGCRKVVRYHRHKKVVRKVC
jgi:hypothetical protein